MERKNSLLNRPRTIEQKIAAMGGEVKARVKDNGETQVFLDIVGLTKAVMIPIVFSHFPHAEIEKEQKNKIVVRIV